MALRKVGVIFTAEGYSQYMGELKQVNQEMRTMATQSKLAVAQLGNNASITSNYSTKMKSMGAEVQVSGQRTKMLTDLQKTLGAEQKRLPDMIEKSTQKYKESNETTKELRKSYSALAKAKGEDAEETLAAEKAYKSSLRETNNLKKEMKELEVVYNQNSKQLEKMPNDIAKAELATAKLTNAQAKLHEEYRNSGGRLADTAKGWQDFGDQAGLVSDKLNTAGNYMTTRFTVPIVAGFGAAIKTGLTFDAQMRQTAAIAGMTTDDLTVVGGAYEQLRGQAIQLGADSIFGATDVALAQEMMASAGFEVIDIISAIPGVMDLAAISGKDMGLASEAVAVAMNQFGLEATDAAHVADVFARAAADTNAETSDMAHALQYAGTVAGAVGWNFEQTAAAIGIMSNAGVKGSQAGTTLRGVVSRLAKPSKQAAEAMEDIGFSAYDAEGNMKQLAQIIPDLRSSFEGMTNEQKENAIVTIFGQEALAGMLALINSAPGEFDALTSSLENSEGAAASMAEVINSGANGAIEELMGSLETLSISLFDNLAPAMIEIIGGITNAVESFGELDEAGQRNVLMWVGIVAAAGPVLSILGKITSISGKAITGVGNVIKLIGKWTTPKAIGETATELGKIPGAAGKAGGAAALFTNPWVVAGVVITGVIAGIGLLIKSDADAPHKAHQESVKETQGAYQEWFDAVTSGAGEAAAAQTALQDATDRTGESYKEQADRILNQNKVIQDNIDTIFQGGFYDAAWAYQLGGYGTGLTSYESLEGQLKNMLPKGQIAEIESDFNGLAVMVGNTMADIGNNFKEQNVVTATWAKGQVDGLATVKAATIENLTAQKNGWLEQAQSESEYHSNSTQWLKERTSEIETEYNRQVAVVERAQDTVYSILTEASAKGRALTETEMVSISRSIMDMAKVSGQSLSELVQAGEVTGEALRAMVTDTGLAFMEAEGMIDKSTADMVRSIKDPGERVAAFMKALEEYDQIKPDKKHLDVDTSDIEVALLEIEELSAAWADLTFEERLAQVETRGKDEIDELLELLGVDWNNLTPEQKRYYAEAEGGEALENILYLTGEWDRSTDPKTKYAILETQIDNEALLAAIEMRDLWNNADFMSLAMEIDTNAPDAEAKLVNLINYFAAQNGQPPLQMETDVLTDDAQADLAALIAAYTGAPVEDVLEFLTSTNADETEAQIGAATEAHEEAGGVGTAEMDTSTNAPDTTGKLVTTGTTLGGLDGRSARVTVNLTDNATVRLQGVGGLISGLNGRVATTYVDTVRRGRAEFAEGGHISPFATGGHVMPAFASGGHIVPNNFQGIVGEAGPEIFTVTNRGVSITPLNSNEKMRGVQGAVADEVSKQLNGKGGSGGDTININITGPTFRDEVDMDKLVTKINKALGTQVHNKKRGRPA